MSKDESTMIKEINVMRRMTVKSSAQKYSERDPFSNAGMRQMSLYHRRGVRCDPSLV